MKKDEELTKLRQQVERLEKLFQQDSVTPTPGGFYLNRRSRLWVTVGLVAFLGWMSIDWVKDHLTMNPLEHLPALLQRHSQSQ